MVSTSEESIRRYRTGQQANVGGVYGQNPTPIYGWHPCREIFPAIAIVQLDKQNPSTPNFLGTQAILRKSGDTSDLPDDILSVKEGIVVFDGTSTDILSLITVLKDFGTDVNRDNFTWSAFGGGDNISCAGDVFFNIILENISDPDSPFFYQDLTYNNAHYNRTQSTHGTLYDDSTRFDDNSASGYK